MAAKSTKPQTNLVKSINSQTTSPSIAEALNEHFIQNTLKCNAKNNNNNSNINHNIDNHINEHNLLDEIETVEPVSIKANECIKLSIKPKINQCNCTNISIMHLFHEMKQKFPTIPDSIVTQCVNENCHHREICIQLLKKELALHPTPVQTFPTKILQQQQQQKFATTSNKPPKPLKPIRAAPTPPPSIGNDTTITAKSASPVTATDQKQFSSSLKNALKSTQNCDSEQQLLKIKDVRNQQSANNNNFKNNINEISYSAVQNNSNKNQAVSCGGECNYETENTVVDMSNRNVSEMRENHTARATTKSPTITTTLTPTMARPRPTTLDLYNQSQRMRQLNTQLQQHLNQRQLRQPQIVASPLPRKPLRQAPLPPKPPKPTPINVCQQQHGVVPLAPQLLQNNSNSSNHNHSNDSTASSCLPSPMSSSESEISVNVSLSSPTTTPTSGTTIALRPHRHRSELTLQPEPPYTRDFLFAASPTPKVIATAPAGTSVSSSSMITATSSPSSSAPSTPNSQRGYTTVNLTLRQPNSNSSTGPPSTIDIFAGPAPNGTGSGLTYQCSSYDPRHGYQKNFQLTVTDEGGIISAARIHPRSPVNQCTLDAETHPDETFDGGSCISTSTGEMRAAASECPADATVPLNIENSNQYHQHKHQQQTQHDHLTLQPLFRVENFMSRRQESSQSLNTPEVFPYPTQTQNHVVASNYNNNHLHTTTGSSSSLESPAEMYLPRELNGTTDEILQRQKARRDKLAAALRNNKTRLSRLEQEINILTDLVPSGESERLDRDIQKLRSDITEMMNGLENARRSDIQQINSQHNSTIRHLSAQQHQQPQPFPQQLSGRQPPSLHLTSQTSSSSSTTGTPVMQQHNQHALQQQLSLQQQPGWQEQHHSLQQQLSLPQQQTLQHQYPLQQQRSLQYQPSFQQTPNLDIVQHHQPPPSYEQYFHQYQQQQRYQQLQQQQRLQSQQQTHHNQQSQQPNQSTDDDEYDSDSDGLADDDDEEPLEMWSCSMCTFRNHPQLNICEACDNVRILPGTIRIVSCNSSNNIANSMQLMQPQQQQHQTPQPQQQCQHAPNHNLNNININHNSANDAGVAATGSSNSTNIENDANLTQQQLQQFALHT